MKAIKRTIVLGASKLALFAMIPMGLEYGSDVVLVTTGNTALEHMRTVHACGLDYPFLYAQDEASLDEFIDRMLSNNIKVGFVHTEHPLFEEVISQNSDAVWFSACREGLYSYLPQIQKHTETPVHILCFDNDKALIDNVRAEYAGTNIHVHKCVAHSICSTVDYDMEHQTVELSGGEECFFYFPPEVTALDLFSYNPRKALAKRAQLRFAADDAEFEFYIKAKLIDVNALHTAVCAAAYVKGAADNTAPDEISTLRISSILDLDTMLQFTTTLHSQMFDQFLKPTADQLGESREIHTELAYNFVNYLFVSPYETVGRGLDLCSASFQTKLDQHTPFLCGVDNAEADGLFKRLWQIIDMMG